MRIVSEEEFHERILQIIKAMDDDIGCVTGPGRSGAVAAVYASHILRIPFIPYGAKALSHLGRLLIIDTATQSGKTLRKAMRKYECADPVAAACFNEPPRVAFWYEACNPQRCRHERKDKGVI